MIHLNFSILVERTNHEFNLASGYIAVPNSNKVIAISIVYQTTQKVIQVKARSTVKIEYLTSIKYSEPILVEQYRQERDAIREKSIDVSFFPQVNFKIIDTRTNNQYTIACSCFQCASSI